MKVLIDTNVFLSYILAPAAQRAVTAVVTACLTLDEIDLLIPPEQLTEFATRAATKRYFRTRIPHRDIDRFVAHLKRLGELLPPLEEIEEITAYSRDPNDDYLVAYGIVHEADYLITGDKDLLVLGRVGQLQIVTPAHFLQLLSRHDLLP